MNLKRIWRRLFSKPPQTEGAPAASVDLDSLDPALLRPQSAPPPIPGSWDDLLEGVNTLRDWENRREVLRQRFLDLIRDSQKPPRPALDLQIHETKEVENQYTRKLISYNVARDERAHAYLALPLRLAGRAPAVLALHGTYEHGKECTAGLVDNPEKAYLDHLARRGFIVLAPDHFVAGHRLPPEGPYDTTRFYQKYPNWTAVGKSTFENSLALDLLQSLPEVDPDRLGVMGHSLGGHGAYFLAAYDDRIQAAACNCAAPSFRHNPNVLDWSRDRWYIYFKHLRPLLLRGLLPPIDMHEIIALIVPRPFLDVAALNDGQPDVQRQRVLMNLKIAQLYDLLRAPENFAFYVHSRSHSVPHDARSLIYAWMDKHLQPAAIKPHLIKR